MPNYHRKACNAVGVFVSQLLPLLGLLALARPVNADSLAQPEQVEAVLEVVTAGMPAYDASRAPYSFKVNAAGGTPPYTWGCSGLPAGLGCDSGGNITGSTAAANNVFSVTFIVLDSLSAGALKTLPLAVYNTPAILSPSPLVEGYLGLDYGSHKIQVAGVSGGQSWAMTAGALPTGMYFNTGSGTLSGTPSQTGVFPFTLELTDGAAVVSANYSLTISPRIVPPFWLRRGLAGGVLDTLVFSPQFGLDKTIIAKGPGGTALYLSTDGGYFWTKLGFVPPSGTISQIALPPDFDGRAGGNQTILVGMSGANALYRSTDLGQNWTALPATAPTVLSSCDFLAYDPGVPGRVLALMIDSGTRKVMASTNLTDWSTVNTGNYVRLVMSPGFAVDQTFFANTFSGESGCLHRSTNGGASFQSLMCSGTDFGNLVLSPNFATDKIAAFLGYNLMISYDGGDSFELAGAGSGIRGPIAFPSDFNMQTKPWIYAVGGGGGLNQLMLSRNAGLSFDPTGTGGMPLSAFSGTFQLAPASGAAQTVIAKGEFGTGMYRSEDGGAVWSPADNGLYLQTFNCAAFAPNSASTLFAGTEQGVYYSTNGGVTWRLSAAGAGVAWPMSISTIAVSPNFANDQTVFAFAFDYARYTGNVLRSTDGGVTFTNPAGNFPTNAYSTRERLAVSPNFANDQRVFVTAGLFAGYSNFYVSYNGGNTYIAVGPGFSGSVYVNEAARFAVSPSYATDSTIYLNHRNSNPWTLRSTDSNSMLFYLPPPAEPWPQYSWLAPVLSPDYNRNAAPSGTNKTIFVGCMKTADEGVTFSAMPVCGNVYLAPTYPTTDLLYVSDNGNNYWDGGTGLFRHSAAIPAYTALTPPAGGSFASIKQVAFSPTFATDSTLLVAGGGGLFLSTNAGDSFTAMTGGDAFSAQVTAVAADPNVTGRLFIGSASAGVALSSDDGASAVPINQGLPAGAVQALLAVGNPAALLAALPDGIYRRTDFSSAGSWSLQASGDFRAFELDSTGGLVFAARQNGASLSSADGGLNWTTLGAQLLDGVSIVRVPGGSLQAEGTVQDGPEARETPAGSTASLWGASLSSGAKYSTNNGNSWITATGGNDYTLPSTSGWSAVTALGLNPQSGGREVLIGHGSLGLYRSLDGGDVWRNVSGTGSGLEATSKNIKALLTSPTAFGTTDILVGVSGATNGGVYLSGDGGEHWTQINQGFDPNNLSISSLVKTSCSGCPVQYYSGSYGSGVYTRTVTVNAPPTFPGSNRYCFGAGCTGPANNCADGASSGPVSGGQPFKLCGGNFQTGAVVEFDGVPASTCVRHGANVLTCNSTPPHAAGAAQVRVRNPDTRASVLPITYTYSGGSSRGGNSFRVAKSSGNATLSWTCSPNCTGASPARIYRSQNAAFSLYLESYNGGTGGSYSNTGAVSTNYSYFWSVE